MFMMELSDITTRLPPRKRLLAGLRNPNPNFELEIPVQLASSEIGSRLREIINAPNLNPQEAIESLKAIALAASETAAKARQIAMEKASIADKAKENAQNALDYLDSISENKNGRRVRGRKPKTKKKHVQTDGEESTDSCPDAKKMTWLARSASRVRAKTRVSDTDEEIAKRLHRTMNSSPRIRKEKKRLVSCDFAVRSSKMTESLAGENEILPKENFHDGNGRKVRIKRKRVIVNRYEDGETESKRLKHTNNFVDCKEKKGDSNSNHGLKENKLTSVWRCIKFKTSKCSSDPKFLHSTGSEAPA